MPQSGNANERQKSCNVPNVYKNTLIGDPAVNVMWENLQLLKQMLQLL